MTSPDRALETAEQILHEAICECGHTQEEHYMLHDTMKCAECTCRMFRPVAFTIARKEKR